MDMCMDVYDCKLVCIDTYCMLFLHTCACTCACVHLCAFVHDCSVCTYVNSASVIECVGVYI